MQEVLYLSHSHDPLKFGALQRYDSFLAIVLKQMPSCGADWQCAVLALSNLAGIGGVRVS